MSEPCPNSRKVKTYNGGKMIGTVNKCDVLCPLCKGSAHVEDCPECDGCGLQKGGARCANCQCYGKIPARAVAV